MNKVNYVRYLFITIYELCKYRSPKTFGKIGTAWGMHL